MALAGARSWVSAGALSLARLEEENGVYNRARGSGKGTFDRGMNEFLKSLHVLDQ